MALLNKGRWRVRCQSFDGRRLGFIIPYFAGASNKNKGVQVASAPANRRDAEIAKK